MAAPRVKRFLAPSHQRRAQAGQAASTVCQVLSMTHHRSQPDLPDENFNKSQKVLKKPKKRQSTYVKAREKAKFSFGFAVLLS